MGDPRRRKRKYSRPSHLWKVERIEEDKELWRKYGLKNRKEIWKARSEITRFRGQARALLASSGEEVEKEKEQILDRLEKLGLLKSRSIDDILALNAEDLLGRRLQTIVCRKGLANTMKQARQLVVHGHVYVAERVIDVPGYVVSKNEEENIRLNEKIKVIKVGEGSSKGEETQKEGEAAQ